MSLTVEAQQDHHKPRHLCDREDPSPVMVWSPQHTGGFLDHVHDAGDRLYAL
jgi:hypothetical protein